MAPLGGENTLLKTPSSQGSRNMDVEAKLMSAAAGRASKLLKSLANPHRLLIVCQLIERENSVGELAEFLGIRDTTVSQHLTLLRKDGIVVPRLDGQTIWYSISSEPARRVLETLFHIFCSPSVLNAENTDALP